jgi:hypothetical protein
MEELSHLPVKFNVAGARFLHVSPAQLDSSLGRTAKFDVELHALNAVWD